MPPGDTAGEALIERMAVWRVVSVRRMTGPPVSRFPAVSIER
jgi:hypothetical protein